MFVLFKLKCILSNICLKSFHNYSVILMLLFEPFGVYKRNFQIDFQLRKSFPAVTSINL